MSVNPNLTPIVQPPPPSSSAPDQTTMPLHIDDLLRYAVSVGASDLHLTAHMPALHPARTARSDLSRDAQSSTTRRSGTWSSAILPGVPAGAVRGREGARHLPLDRRTWVVSV